MKRKWIANAIRRPGALTRSAKALYMTPMEYARTHAHAPGIAGKRARLALTLRKLH